MSQLPPPAFRESPSSGLILPQELSRKRIVWTTDKRKLLDRVGKMLQAEGIAMFLKCTDPVCDGKPMTAIRQIGGGYILQCGHADRVFQKGY